MMIQLHNKGTFSRLFVPVSIVSFLMFLPCSILYAGTKAPKNYKNEKISPCKNGICDPFRLVVVATGGAAFSKIGQSDTFHDDSSFYSYSANTATQTKGLWGAAVGEELRFSPDWAIQLSIAYYQMFAYTARGTVTQGVDDPTSEVFPYDYNITTRQYLFESKILGDATQTIHPYLLLGVGASFNTVNGYTASPGLSTFTPQFDENTNTNFSYSAGVGLDVDFNKNIRLGVGYRYSGLGPAKLGNGTINTVYITDTFGQENLNTQEVVAQITFLI